MSGRRMRGLNSRLEAVRDQFEHWRRTRHKRSPIPEALWDAAVALATEHGINRVTKALRLSYPDLKRRAQAATNPGPAKKISPPAFVELNCGPSLSPAPCVVEIENLSGVKMRISLRQPDSVDLAALIQAFGSLAG